MRDLTVVTAGRVTIVIGQLLFLKLIITHLNTFELGSYYFLLTTSYALTALLFVPLDFYQQQKAFELLREGTSLKSFLRPNLNLGLALVATTVVFSLLLPNRAGTVVLVSAVSAGLLYVITTMRNLLSNMGHRRDATAALVAETYLKIVFLLLLLEYWDPSALNLLISNIFALATLWLLLIWQFRRLELFAGARRAAIPWKEVFHFIYPMSLSSVFNWLQLQGFRLVLVPLGFAETVGLYSAISSIGSNGMLSASQIFSQMFIPNVYKTRGRYTSEYLRKALLLGIGVALISYILKDFIVGLLTKPEFVRSSIILVFGVASEIGNFLIWGMVIHFTIQKNTKPLLIATILGSITATIGIGIALQTGVTIISIGSSILASQAVAVLVMFWLFSRHPLITDGVGAESVAMTQSPENTST